MGPAEGTTVSKDMT